MSAAFLLVMGPQAKDRVEAASAWIPFEPEHAAHHAFDGGTTRLAVWSVVMEAARGQYLDMRSHGDGTTQSCLVYDGHIAEGPDTSEAFSISQVFHDLVRLRGLDRVARDTAGDWCCLRRDAETGQWEGATDFLGACHLYYGQRDGHVVVSNRALVAATALWGSLPKPSLKELAFVHAAFSCAIGRRTCWPDIHMLDPSQRLVVHAGQFQTVSLQAPETDTPLSYDEAFERLVQRCRAITRFDGLRFRLTVTGGKDSRAVLGGLVAADALANVETCYLEGDPSAPDAVVGRRLAEHYGLPFVMEPASYERHVDADADIMKAFGIHNFQAELFLNAWDLKGALSKPRTGDVRGYYGEIYKSHDLSVFRLGWPVVKLAYGSRWFVDPWGILTAPARRHVLDAVNAYVLASQHQGYRAAGMHHRFHREQRMRRWCGQAQRSDAMGSLMLNPLSDPRLFQHYFSLSRSDQSNCRIHYELIRRADPWLAKQPFADFSWKLPGVVHPDPVGNKSAGFVVSPQLRLWQLRGAELEAFMLDRSTGPEFFEVYNYRALRRLLTMTRIRPSHRRLKAVMAACALKHAMTHGITPHRFRVEPPA